MLVLIGYLFVAFCCYIIGDLIKKILYKKKIIEFDSFENGFYVFFLGFFSLMWYISIPLIAGLAVIILLFMGASVLSDKIAGKIEQKFNSKSSDSEES